MDTIDASLRKIDDQRLSTRFQNTLHLFERTSRFAEILEGRPANKKVEHSVTERHSGRVATEKANLNTGSSCIRARDLHKRFAYVQSRDLIIAQPRKLDSEISRPGRDFENAILR